MTLSGHESRERQRPAGFSIIDTLMNLPLLFWAARERNEPRFYNLAIPHLDHAAREFVRDDHSVYHIVEFDRHTGTRAHGGQGHAPESAWSRRQGWAISGVAIAARYSGQEKYRTLSRKISDRFIEMNRGHPCPTSKVSMSLHKPCSPITVRWTKIQSTTCARSTSVTVPTTLAT